MTEAEWLCLDQPCQLLSFLRDRATDRKTCLLACACCRRVWHLLSDVRSREAVEVAECFADGLVTDEERETARVHADEANAYEYFGNEDVEETPERLVAYLLRDAATYAASEFSYYHSARQEVLPYVGSWSLGKITEALAVLRTNSWDEALAQADDDTIYSSGIIGIAALSTDERLAQATLLRDIFGNPFRPVRVESSWLAWNDGTVVKLAQGIYEDLAFDRLPMLADALEEAGCDSADILAHCRSPGPHVRGCWVVDCLIGRR